MSDESENNIDESDNNELVANEGGDGIGLVEHDAPLKPSDDGLLEQKSASDLQTIFDAPVKVSAVLGSSKIKVSDLIKMERGTILELDRKVGESIDIFVNNRLVARGEVVLVDKQLGVTMTEIIAQE